MVEKIISNRRTRSAPLAKILKVLAKISIKFSRKFINLAPAPSNMFSLLGDSYLLMGYSYCTGAQTCTWKRGVFGFLMGNVFFSIEMYG